VARPIKQRKILSPFPETGFFSSDKNISEEESILFLAEEFESIKLIDYEGLDQTKAAKLMHISRPTFTRIYKRARIKLATALVEKKVMKISGENIYYGDNWYKCPVCECIYNTPKNTNSASCPLCKNPGLESSRLEKFR